MALTKEETKRMTEAVNERKKEAAVDEMKRSAEETLNEADKQREYHYNEMLKCVREKNYKSAKRNARMYMFMDKLSKMVKEYSAYLEDMETISMTMKALDKMNRGFAGLMGMTSSTTVSTDMVKNMQKFGKQMSKFDKQMDQMMGAMDDILDEPKRGKGSKGGTSAPVSDEADFMNFIAGNADLSSRYQASAGPSSAAGAPAAGAAPATPAGGAEDIFSVGNPYE